MNNNKYPLVSVVIPVYNNVAWLEEAVESVIQQDYPNIEILVINDGSTESFESFIKKYNNLIKYYYNDNKGVAYARNFGIDKSTGDYIAFLDSDDLWDKHKISSQIEYMKKYKMKWSQHNYAYFDSKSKEFIKTIFTHNFQGEIIRYIFTSCLIQTSCIMVERKILENNPEIRFDENKKFGEDNIFYLLLASKYPLGYLNKTLTYYRIRGGNAGQSVAIQLNYRSMIYEEYHRQAVYNNNTNLATKFAYKYCYIVNRKFYNTVKHNNFLTKLLYVIPWTIFKINYFLFCIGENRNE